MRILWRFRNRAGAKPKFGVSTAQRFRLFGLGRGRGAAAREQQRRRTSAAPARVVRRFAHATRPATTFQTALRPRTLSFRTMAEHSRREIVVTCAAAHEPHHYPEDDRSRIGAWGIFLRFCF